MYFIIFVLEYFSVIKLLSVNNNLVAKIILEVHVNLRE